MRLDRSICNDECLAYWNSISCCTLTRSHSDHFPLLMTLQKGILKSPSSFKFLSVWSEHPDCRRLVREVWQKEIKGCPMYILSQKLKSLKKVLKTWNRKVFGNINSRVELAQLEIGRIQSTIMSDGISESLQNQEKVAQTELQMALFM